MLLACVCQLAVGEPAYHHILGHMMVSKDTHNSLCPKAFLPTDNDANDLHGKLGCCIIDKMLSAVEVTFDAEVCGKGYTAGQYKGMAVDGTKHCKNGVGAGPKGGGGRGGRDGRGVGVRAVVIGDTMRPMCPPAF